MEATYRNEVAQICAWVNGLLRTSPAVEALAIWMDRFLDFLATKHGMAQALRAVLAAEEGLRQRTRESLTDALAVLLSAGVEQRTIRSDVDPADVLMSIGGVALIAGEPDQREQARRLLAILMDGLRYRDRSVGP